MITRQTAHAATLVRANHLYNFKMKTFLAALIVGTVAVAAGPTFAQEKKSEPTKEESKKAEVKKAEKEKGEKGEKAEAKKDGGKKKVKKGGC